MGRDKALLEVDGRPLWQRQRDLLTAAGASEILLSARPDQAWTRSVKGFAAVVHDALPDCGPMVGITAGLERAAQPWLAVLAIDLPLMPVEWFARLFELASTGVGVVGRRGEFFEPLAAIYPREMKWLAWDALVKHEYTLQRLVSTAVQQGLLRVHELEERELPWFANWNQGAVAEG
jgi:molybdenum cofactor guanylyltransferase